MLKPRSDRKFDPVDARRRTRDQPAAERPATSRRAACRARHPPQQAASLASNSSASTPSVPVLGAEIEARQIQAADVEKRASRQARCSAAAAASPAAPPMYQKAIWTSCGVLRTSSMKRERDVAHQPIVRQPHDADQQAEQRRSDDPGGGDQKRVERADEQRPGVGVADMPVDQMERNIEIGEIGQEGEAEVHVAEVQGCPPTLDQTGTRRPPPARATAAIVLRARVPTAA